MRNRSIRIFILMIFILLLAGCSKSNDILGSASSTSIAVPTSSQTSEVVNKTKYKTAVVIDYTKLSKKPESNMVSSIELQKGALITIISEDNGWCYVELLQFEVPSTRGYLEKSQLSYDFIKYIPSQGTCNHKNFYKEPDLDSQNALDDYSGSVNITKIENGWAFCNTIGGSLCSWVRESEIDYPTERIISDQYNDVTN